MIENVPGMVSFEGGATLEVILESLRKLGYDADVRILYAPHYGVPQMRWRTIILGHREGGASSVFPEPLRQAPVRVNFTSQFGGRNLVAMPRSLELLWHVTVKDAIHDLPVLCNGEVGEKEKVYRFRAQNAYQKLMRMGSNAVTCHEAARLSKVNLDRMAHIPPGGGRISPKRCCYKGCARRVVVTMPNVMVALPRMASPRRFLPNATRIGERISIMSRSAHSPCVRQHGYSPFLIPTNSPARVLTSMSK